MPEKDLTKTKPDEEPEQSLVLFGQTNQLPQAVQRAIDRYGLKTREKAGVAPTWKPEKAGDYVIGEVLNIRHQVGQFKSTVISLGAQGGVTAVWLSSDLKLKLDGIQVGQVYCIQYDGILTKKDNPKLKNDMKLYKVVEILR